MIHCWVTLRRVGHAIRHRPRVFRHAVPHVGVKKAAVATVVCTVMGGATGGVFWLQPNSPSAGSAVYGGGLGGGVESRLGRESAPFPVFDTVGQRLGAVTDERLDTLALPLGNVSVAPTDQPQPVPEPSALLLFAPALAALLLLKRGG